MQSNTKIGKVGLFFNDISEKTYKIGRLKSVTPDGKHEDEDCCCYNNFTPMARGEMLEIIDLDFYC